jgi:hypothetical protein
VEIEKRGHHMTRGTVFGGSMSDNHDNGPARLDLYPLPGTPEAKARGCRCAPATKPDGSPLLDSNGRQLYRIEKGCPVHG